MSLESLLNLIENPDDRTALEQLTAKHPKLTETLTRAQQYEAWAAENWDTDHGMPKVEYRQRQQIADLLRQQAEQGASGMELSELNQWLDGEIKAGRILTPDAVKQQLDAVKADRQWITPVLEETIKSREEQYTKYFGELVNTQAKVATMVPYLNQKHLQEYGTLFNPNDFLTKATEAKATDLEAFYGVYTKDAAAKKAEEAEAARKAEVERLVAEAEARGKKTALQEVALGNNGVNQIPTSDSGPEMGHFQAKLMGLNKVGEGAPKSPVPDGAELGKGTIAAAMARAGDKAEIEGRVN